MDLIEIWIFCLLDPRGWASTVKRHGTPVTSHGLSWLLDLNWFFFWITTSSIFSTIVLCLQCAYTFALFFGRSSNHGATYKFVPEPSITLKIHREPPLPGSCSLHLDVKVNFKSCWAAKYLLPFPSISICTPHCLFAFQNGTSQPYIEPQLSTDVSCLTALQCNCNPSVSILPQSQVSRLFMCVLSLTMENASRNGGHLTRFVKIHCNVYDYTWCICIYVCSYMLLVYVSCNTSPTLSFSISPLKVLVTTIDALAGTLLNRLITAQWEGMGM